MTLHRGTADRGQIRRARGAALALLLAVTGAAMVGPTSASAASPSPAAATPAPVWQATVSPTSGSDTDYLSIATSGGCPATNVVGRMFGAGLPATGAVVIGNTAAGVTQYGAFTLPLAVTMRDVIAEQPELFRPSGSYRLALSCHTSASLASVGDYVARITYTSSTAWAATGPVTTAQGPIATHPAQPTSGPVTDQGTTAAQRDPAKAVAAQPLASGPARTGGTLAGNRDPVASGPATWLVISLAGMIAAAVAGYLWRTRRRPTDQPLDAHPRHQMTGVSS